MNPILRSAGAALARWLSATRHAHGTSRPTPLDRLSAALRPADVLLVEGDSRISVAIKYLTQSTWSHAALFTGPVEGLTHAGDCFVEADLIEGVRSVGFAEFAGCHTRICRAVGLSDDERRAVVDYAVKRIGHTYDLKNVVDLARYLVPTPPVPTRWRRHLIGLGSGDPTRAICSSLIADAFQTIRYPILPVFEDGPAPSAECPDCVAERALVRHASLYTPRDFDASPYFQVVKPTVESGFDFHTMPWAS